MLYLNCIAPEGPSPTYYGEKPGLSKFVSQAGLVNVPSGQLEPMSSVLQARHDPENLVGQVHDWGGCHLDMTDDMARLIALFIEKAAKYRLSDDPTRPACPSSRRCMRRTAGWRQCCSRRCSLQWRRNLNTKVTRQRRSGFLITMAEAAMGFEIENRTKLPRPLPSSPTAKRLRR